MKSKGARESRKQAPKRRSSMFTLNKAAVVVGRVTQAPVLLDADGGEQVSHRKSRNDKVFDLRNIPTVCSSLSLPFFYFSLDDDHDDDDDGDQTFLTIHFLPSPERERESLYIRPFVVKLYYLVMPS